jgi:preprotein translocase subunit SecA
MENYKRKEQIVSSDQLKQVEKYVYLQLIDTNWKEHLYTMDRLRDSVGLRAHGQRDPLQEYKKEGYTQFAGLIGQIESDAVLAMHRMPPPEEAPVLENTAQLDLDSLDYNNPDVELENSRISGGGAAAAAGFAVPQHQGPDESQMIMSGSGGGGGAATFSSPVVRDGEKVGRNDPCPCGSGKKYKKCHGGPAGRAQA